MNAISHDVHVTCLSQIHFYDLDTLFALIFASKNANARKTRVTQRKTLGARMRTNNKLNPHMTLGPGFKPGPHRWETSALTTAPSQVQGFVKPRPNKDESC